MLDKTHPHTCKFLFEDAVLYDKGIAVFENKDAATGSPLPEKLFELEGVTAVRVSASSVSVTRDGAENWRPQVVNIIGAIREFCESGQSPVAEAFEPIRIPEESVIKKRVSDIFDTQINPAVASHGGVIELLDVRGTDVYLRMGGGCQGCGMASATLRQGIEATLREELPYIGEILDVTDHAGGTNPYYAAAH